MGIRYLNRFLKDNASPSINFCRLAELSGKKIAIDISIYMYRFASEDTLIESMYLMLSIFRNYNIIPIFIFDGKPPPEKRELLKKRKEDKQEAEEEGNSQEDQNENSQEEEDSADEMESAQVSSPFKRQKLDLMELQIAAISHSLEEKESEDDELNEF